MSLALAQGATFLTFVRPAAQGPGTSGFQIAADPTIQAILSDGLPTAIDMTAAIDLQGNGRPDLVACHAVYLPRPNGRVPCRILRPQPDGSVIDVTRQLLGAGALPLVTHPREIVGGDFNHDGRQDVFVAAHGYDTSPWPGEVNVLLISNANGTYTDRSSTLPQVPDFSHSATVGDVDGDGHLDIYVGNVFGAGSIGPYFLMGRGDGTYTQNTTGLPAQIMNLQERFTTCALVDMDRDGHADLVLGSHAANGYFDNIVLFNNGAGDFTVRTRLVLPPGPLPQDNFTMMDIAPLDIDRDGRPDLVLLAQSNSGSGVGLQVLINKADGSVVDESSRLGGSNSRLTGPWSAFLRATDLNGDGWEDLFLDSMKGGSGVGYSRVWLSNGNGTWTPQPSTALPTQLSGGTLHAVDFEGDGRADILLLCCQAPGSDIGYQTFLNRTTRTVPSEPIIGAVVAHNARAGISFSAPLASGTSPITGYTATCGPGQITGTGTTSPISVTGLTNGRHYSCAVTATNSAGVSTPSVAALVTPFLLPFIDEPVVAGATVVKAAQITELRARTNALRATVGLAAFSWTDSTLTATSSLVKAAHITELRTALAAAYVAAGIPPPTFTDPSLVGVAVKALHIAQIRMAIAALE